MGFAIRFGFAMKRKFPYEIFFLLLPLLLRMLSLTYAMRVGRARPSGARFCLQMERRKNYTCLPSNYTFFSRCLVEFSDGLRSKKILLGPSELSKKIFWDSDDEQHRQLLQILLILWHKNQQLLFSISKKKYSSNYSAIRSRFPKHVLSTTMVFPLQNAFKHWRHWHWHTADC